MSWFPCQSHEGPLHPHSKDKGKLVRQLSQGVVAHLTTPTSQYGTGPYHLLGQLETESGKAPRVAFLLSGTRGDHSPSVPLCLALQKRGIEVKVFAKKSFEKMYVKHGIPMVGLPGVDYEEIFTDSSVRSGLAFGEAMVTNLAINHILETTYEETACLDQIVEGLKEFQPTLVLWHMCLVVEAIVASHIFKCPSVCIAFFPYAPTSEIPCFPLAPQMSPDSCMNCGGYGVRTGHSLLWKHFYLLGKGAMKRHVWETYKIPLSGSDLFDRYGSPRWPMICAWSPALGPRPKDYHDGVQGPVGFLRLSEAAQSAQFSVPPGLEEFVKKCYHRDQLAYIGWGSMGSGSDEGLTKLAVGSLFYAKAKGIVQGGYSDLQLEKLEDPELKQYASENVYFVPKDTSIPHNWLFPQCGVCVHHGGVGTLAACLYAGTPSIVTPVFVDQFYWAKCIQKNGTGLYGPNLASASIKKLGACLKTCLEDLRGDGIMAAKAKALGEKMQAEVGVDKTVEFLEKILSEGWQPPE